MLLCVACFSVYLEQSIISSSFIMKYCFAFIPYTRVKTVLILPTTCNRKKNEHIGTFIPAAMLSILHMDKLQQSFFFTIIWRKMVHKNDCSHYTFSLLFCFLIVRGWSFICVWRCILVWYTSKHFSTYSRILKYIYIIIIRLHEAVGDASNGGNDEKNSNKINKNNCKSRFAFFISQ